MKCFVHPTIEAQGVCRECGKGMCVDCSSFDKHSGYCPNCKREIVNKKFWKNFAIYFAIQIVYVYASTSGILIGILTIENEILKNIAIGVALITSFTGLAFALLLVFWGIQKAKIKKSMRQGKGRL